MLEEDEGFEVSEEEVEEVSHLRHSSAPVYYATVPTAVASTASTALARAPPAVPSPAPLTVMSPTVLPITIRKNYARFDTSCLKPLPALPFQSSNSVTELIQCKSSLNSAVDSNRVTCDDHDDDTWTRGWEYCLEKHVVRAK